MEKGFKISVIIPVYKVENCIEKCVRSLFGQTLKNIQYIFVDDASPDHSIDKVKKVLEDYPERESQCLFLRHEFNKGVTAARNTGLKYAEGNYIMYCDSDDWISFDLLELMYSFAVAEDADIVYCDFAMVFPDHTKEYKQPDWDKDKTKALSRYITLVWTQVWNLLVKKTLYDTYNLYFPENITYCEDFHLSVRLFFYANKVCHLKEIGYFYNQMNQSSIMHNLD